MDRATNRPPSADQAWGVRTHRSSTTTVEPDLLITRIIITGYYLYYRILFVLQDIICITGYYLYYYLTKDTPICHGWAMDYLLWVNSRKTAILWGSWYVFTELIQEAHGDLVIKLRWSTILYNLYSDETSFYLILVHVMITYYIEWINTATH